MARQRDTHSEADLRRASMAVDYEVNTLSSALDLLLRSGTTEASPPPEQALSNALLHTLLIAARNLFHFLYSHQSRPTDLIAEDFFNNDDDWADVRPDAPPEFQDGAFVRSVSRRLAHLTWDRIGDQPPRWIPWQIVSALVRPLTVFVQEAPAERVQHALREDVELLRRLLRNWAI